MVIVGLGWGLEISAACFGGFQDDGLRVYNSSKGSLFIFLVFGRVLIDSSNSFTEHSFSRRPILMEHLLAATV